MSQPHPAIPSPPAHFSRTTYVGVAVAALLVIAVLVWQALAAHGSPDPTDKSLGALSAMVQAGVLVLREGLEAILVLAALTASLIRTQASYRRPVAIGAGLSFGATLVTWFIVVALLGEVNASEYALQAGTGLLAVVVLMVIMNWFFHKIYWGGWIALHNRQKRHILAGAAQSPQMIYRGLVLLGFTSVYREGFEVVLFLQHLRLEVGMPVVLPGVLVGLVLTALVGVLTFVAHARLPYRQMLVLTGIMLGAVFIVMVGETVFEMQQAGWLPKTLFATWPEWLNTWFAVYPSVQSVVAQAATAGFVIGSYYLARHVAARRHTPLEA